MPLDFSPVPWLLYAVGGLFLLLGMLLLILDSRREKRLTARAEATVVEVRAVQASNSILARDQNSGYRYLPTLEYEVEGQRYRIQGPANTSNYRVGQRLTINYDPARPGGDRGSLRLMGNGVAIIGAALLIWGALAG